MACCKSEEEDYEGWCKDLSVVEYRDEDGMEYCVFHAPQGKKGVDLETFNELIFERLNEALQDNGKCDLRGTIFEGPITFGEFHAAKLPVVDFGWATFQVADFWTVMFNDVNFSEATFLEEAHFSGATFSEKADFIKTTFSEKISFADVVFSKRASFTSAVFSGEASFPNAKFEEASFAYATFKKAYFNGATFSEEAYFSQTTFEEASFPNTTFSREADFSRAEFKEANFNDATFSEKAVFSIAIFTDMALFWRAMFSERADFNRVAFKEASFDSAKFKEASFVGATFSERADFNGVAFKEASFAKATFKEVSFFSAKFSDIAFFSGTVFEGKAVFWGTMFSDMAFFTGATFKEAEFRGHAFLVKCDFRAVTVQERVCFDSVDLENVSFLDTNLENVTFINPTWREKRDRYVLYDEILLETEDLDVERKKERLEKVRILYNTMKQKNKKGLDEAEAARWHYGEKEMQRRLTSFLRNPFQWVILHLYWLSSGYAEAPVRAGGVLLAAILGFSLLLAAAGLEAPKPEEPVYGIEEIKKLTDIDEPRTFGVLVLNTLQYGIFQKEPIFNPARGSLLAGYLKVLAQILLPLQTALFILAVRNRFRR